MKREFPALLIAILMSALLYGCAVTENERDDTPHPTQPPLPTLTPYPTHTPYPTQPPLPTLTPYPTHTPYPTQSPLPTPTPYPTHTPYPTQSPLPTPTPYPTQPPLPTLTPTPAPTPTPDPAHQAGWNAVPSTPTPAINKAVYVRIPQTHRVIGDSFYLDVITHSLPGGYEFGSHVACPTWVFDIADATPRIQVSGPWLSGWARPEWEGAPTPAEVCLALHQSDILEKAKTDAAIQSTGVEAAKALGALTVSLGENLRLNAGARDGIYRGTFAETYYVDDMSGYWQSWTRIAAAEDDGGGFWLVDYRAASVGIDRILMVLQLKLPVEENTHGEGRVVAYVRKPPLGCAKPLMAAVLKDGMIVAEGCFRASTTGDPASVDLWIDPTVDKPRFEDIESPPPPPAS